MWDVAAAAGVSQSTVSRVLNDAPSAIGITEETRERIRAAAEALGYRPNPLARALRGAPTMLLGAIVRDITDPFFAGVIDTLSTQGSRLGYNLVLGQAHARAHEALALKNVLETRHCDAIIVLGDMSDQPVLVDELRGSTMPLVGMWQGGLGGDVPSVEVDNRAGIDSVVQHLCDLGHREIAFVSGGPLGDIREREEAFAAATTARGIASDRVVHAPNDPGGGAAAAHELLGSSTPPTAIVAATDNMAVGILHAAHDLGVAVPGELSVSGFDDLPVSRFLVPALTTVSMPVEEMVAAALDLAIGTVPGGGTAPAVSRVVAPALVVRGSTAPPEEFDGGAASS